MTSIAEKESICFSIPALKFNIQTLSSDTSDVWRKLHSHNAIELIFVNIGTIYCHVGDEALTLSKGDILIINSDVVHYIEAFAYASITYIQTELQEYFTLGDSPETMLYEFISHTKSSPYFFSDKEDELHDIFYSMKAEAYGQSSFYDIYIKSLLYHLTGFLFRNGMLVSLDAEILHRLEPLLPVTELIEMNYSHSLSLDMLCDKIKYNKFELCRKFKQVTGKTVVEYINYIRLYHAKKLLQENKKNITEIAFLCGFSSVQYFNKVFKKYNGCSPKTYIHHSW